jgi:hypothetical protein
VSDGGLLGDDDIIVPTELTVFTTFKHYANPVEAAPVMEFYLYSPLSPLQSQRVLQVTFLWQPPLTQAPRRTRKKPLD